MFPAPFGKFLAAHPSAGAARLSALSITAMPSAFPCLSSSSRSSSHSCSKFSPGIAHYSCGLLLVLCRQAEEVGRANLLHQLLKMKFLAGNSRWCQVAGLWEDAIQPRRARTEPGPTGEGNSGIPYYLVKEFFQRGRYSNLTLGATVPSSSKHQQTNCLSPFITCKIHE